MTNVHIRSGRSRGLLILILVIGVFTWLMVRPVPTKVPSSDPPQSDLAEVPSDSSQLPDGRSRVAVDSPRGSDGTPDVHAVGEVGVRVVVQRKDSGAPVPVFSFFWTDDSPEATQELRRGMEALSSTERLAVGETPVATIARCGYRATTDMHGVASISPRGDRVTLVAQTGEHWGLTNLSLIRDRGPWSFLVEPGWALGVRLLGSESTDGLPIALEWTSKETLGEHRGRSSLGISGVDGRLWYHDLRGLVASGAGRGAMARRVGGDFPGGFDASSPLSLLGTAHVEVDVLLPALRRNVECVLCDSEGVLIEDFAGTLEVTDGEQVPWRFPMTSGRACLPAVVQSVEFEWRVISPRRKEISRRRVSLSGSGERIGLTSRLHSIAYMRVVGEDGRPVAAGSAIELTAGDWLGVAKVAKSDGSIRCCVPIPASRLYLRRGDAAGSAPLNSVKAEICDLGLVSLRKTSILAHVHVKGMDGRTLPAAVVSGVVDGGPPLTVGKEGDLYEGSASAEFLGRSLTIQVEAPGHLPKKIKMPANGGTEEVRLERVSKFEATVTLPPALGTDAVSVYLRTMAGVEIPPSRTMRRRGEIVTLWETLVDGQLRLGVRSLEPVYDLCERVVTEIAESGSLKWDLSGMPWRRILVELKGAESPRQIFVAPWVDGNGLDVTAVARSSYLVTDDNRQFLFFGPSIQGLIVAFTGVSHVVIEIREVRRVRLVGEHEIAARLVCVKNRLRLESPVMYRVVGGEGSVARVDLRLADLLGGESEASLGLHMPFSYRVEVGEGRAVPEIIDGLAGDDVVVTLTK